MKGSIYGEEAQRQYCKSRKRVEWRKRGRIVRDTQKERDDRGRGRQKAEEREMDEREERGRERKSTRKRG